MQWISLKRAVQRGGRPRGWWLLYITGVISALIIPMMLIVLGLIAELLTTRGRLDLSADEAKIVADWVDPDTADEDNRPAKDEAGGESTGRAEVDGRVQYEGRGLLPLVYRNRDNPLVGAAIVARYRLSGWMRSNEGCLVVLVLFGTLLGALESLSLAVFYVVVRRTALDVGTRLRGAIYDHAFHLGVFDLLGDRVTQAEHLITEQIPAVEEGLARWWRAAARSTVIVVTSLILALFANVWTTVVTLVLGILVWLLYFWLRSRTENQVRLGKDRASRELDRLLEQLRQVPLVAGYLLSRVPGEPRDDTLRRFRQQAEQATASGALVGPVLHLFVVLGAALILWLVGCMILFFEPAKITVSETVVLGASLLVVYFPARRLFRLRETMPTAERAATAVFAYLDREPSLGEASGARPLGRIRDNIQLQSVTLADRKGRKLLDNVSLTIRAGTKTAIVASDS